MFTPAVQDPRFRFKRQVSVPYNVPAPTGGINARDSLTGMKPDDAVTLTNVFPEATTVVVRRGNTSWSTGMSTAVQTLLVWRGGSGTDKLFSATATKIWDSSASGAASAAVNSLTNGKWQWTNITTAGGSYLIACNGADAVQAFDGTTWTTPSITGPTSSTFIQVCQFKERLWFAPVNSLTLYYLGTQAIAGAATAFPLGSVFRNGGYIIGLSSFSNDAGEGPDDYFVICTSQGEVAVYQGTDPTSATTWSLVGRFEIGKPIGRRSTVRLSGDVAIVTQDGVESMQAALRFDRSSGQKAAITAKIQTLFSQFSRDYFTHFGWQPCVYPKSRYLIINVPAVEGSQQNQLVMNTITGAWGYFTNMNGNCWAMANDLLYYGGNAGVTYQADVGYTDQGAVINWEVQTSWQAWGGKMNKLFTAVRPEMLTGGAVSFAIGIDVDFVVRPPIGVLNTPAVTGMVWTWTWPGTWGGVSTFDAQWHSVGSFGTWASMHMTGIVNGQGCSINAFDFAAQKQTGTIYG